MKFHGFSCKRWIVGLLSTTAIVGTAMTPSWAAETQLAEITVTAQKIEENLQSVPLALSAFTSDYLTSQNIGNFQDLKSRIPSFVYDEWSPVQPRYYIRGIGNNLQSGAVDEDVGIFVDGVYLSRPSMTNTEFLDMDRIEVLRGPQGTLFGRNVVGGAMSFISRKPTQELRMGAEATYGNYKDIVAKGFVSGPLTETIAASFAATSRSHDGYSFNTTTNNDVGDEQYSGVRGAIRFTPSDALDMQFIADASRRRGTGQFWTFYRNLGTSFTQPDSDPWRGAHTNDDGVSDADNEGYSFQVDYDAGYGTWTSISAYRASFFAQSSNVTSPNSPPTGLTIPELAAALATGAYSNYGFIQDYHEDADQISQEIRLAGSISDRVKYVLGVYYFQSDIDFTSRNFADYNFPSFFLNHATAASGSSQVSDTTAYAGFGNVSYGITDSLTLQAGVRWSHDKKSGTITAFGVPQSVLTGGPPYTINGVRLPIGVGYTTEIEGTWSAWTPTLSVNYQATPDKFLYVAASRGFKSGGLPNANNEMTLTLPLDPEYAWSYEVGAKTEWLDKRLRFNISGFWMDYKDLQLRGLQTLPGALTPTGFVTNAGETTSKGVEAELDFIVTEGFNLYGSYTYTKAEIDKSSVIGCPDPSNASRCPVRVGDELIKAPHDKVFVGASYTANLTEALSATLRADYSYTSSYFAQLPNNGTSCFFTAVPPPNVAYCEQVPSQHTIGAGLLFEGEDGHWGVEFWGKNLTDELNPNSLTAVPFYGVATFWDPPRTYGITVRFRN